MKRVWGVGMSLCLVSCIADTSDSSMTGDTAEDIAEAQEELTLVSHPPIDLRDAVREAAVEKRLTGWRVYVRGQNGPYKRHSWASPRDADKMGTLYVMRESDLHDNKAWIALSLLDVWLDGDRYFEEMMKKHHLTPLDLIGILAALQEVGDAPPQLSALLGRLSTFDEGGGDFPPFPTPTPLPGGDHSGPGWGWPASVPTPPPGTPHPPPGPTAGGGFNPGDPSTWGPRPVPHKTDAQTLREWQDTYLGAHDGEPAVPAPTDAGYAPLPGEKKVTFRCDGVVVNGYANGCLDFKEMPFTMKWVLKFGAFMDWQPDRLARFVVHTLFHDGKGQACVNDCTQLGFGVAGLGMSAVMLVCLAATRGLAVDPCFNGAASIASWAGSSVSAASLAASVNAKCLADVCTEK